MPASTKPLNAQSLPQLPRRALNSVAAVHLPAYPRHALMGQVVHLGLGAFHRAHQAMVFDRLLASGDTRWGITGVAMHNPTLADALAAQDGLYSVQVCGLNEQAWHIPGSLLRTLVASRTRAAAVAAIAEASTRWLTLTVTEKGYGGALAALIVDGLAARKQAGHAGITIASCDNLTNNGSQLQTLCLMEARQRAAALAHWVEKHCTFPCSMVDRIVPASTPALAQKAQVALGVSDAAALGTEVFWEWVLQNRFVESHDAAALASCGVMVVDDVKAFEDAKLRMLNASHSILALLGAVLGLQTIAHTVVQPAARQLVAQFMTHCAMPTLARPSLPVYRAALLTRFANPHLHHSVHQVASDSSLKIPLRWLPVLHEALLAGECHVGRVDTLAFALALWIRYLRGTDDVGHTYTFNDPHAPALQTLAYGAAQTNGQRIKAVLNFAPMFDTPVGVALRQHPAWQAQVLPRVAHWLEHMQQQGMQGALAIAAASAVT